MNKKNKVIAILLVHSLLLIFLLQCIFSMMHISSTSDEVAHLPAGYSYLKTGDFKLNPEHPPLVKIIAAYPLLFLDLPHPYTNKYFIENEKWEYGKSLIYRSVESAEKILFLGRMIIILLGLLLAVLVYSWTKDLFGNRAALFSLFLFAFEPNLIAHSRLVTTDIGFSLFFLLTIYWMWKYFQKPSVRFLLLCGLSCGLAFATKFSAILLCPIIAILFGLELFLFYKKTGKSSKIEGSSIEHSDPPLNSQRSLKPFIFFLIGAPILTSLVIAASYGFLNLRYYFIGLKSVFLHSKMGHAGFMAGQYADTGWLYYFPLAFLLKTPIPLLIFFLVSILLAFYYLIFSKNDSATRLFSLHITNKNSDIGAYSKNKTANKNNKIQKELGDKPQEHRKPSHELKETIIRNWSYLLFPPLFFLSVSLMSRLNIGLRHILPIFPFAMILCGIIFTKSLLENARWKKLIYLIIGLLSLWYVAESYFIFPHYISYFNESIGGPSRGYKYFVDSNLDWGQDIPALKKFLEQNHIEGVILAYFGNADPYYYGIKYQYLPLCGKPKIPLNYRPPEKDFDYIAISATHLQAVFTFDHTCFDWLKNREPDARIAYSIFLYDIKNDAEAHRKLAEIYFESKMNAEAKKHILKSQALTPKNEQ